MRTKAQRGLWIFALSLAVAPSGGWATPQADTRSASAQQPSAAASAVRQTSELENEETHVWKMHIPSRQTSALHRHNHPRVVIALTGGAVRIVQKSGESKVMKWEAGKPYWMPADPSGAYHTYVNDTDRPIEFMYIEFERSR